MDKELATSGRFQAPVARRDFLGLTAAWTAIVAFVMAMLGALRLPMPSVFPESDSQVKLGKPDRFALGSRTYFPRHRLWLYHDEEGFRAVSSVCTHLGCVVDRAEEGTFSCPCHGSKFDQYGKVTGGPAPKGLVWVEVGVSPEGWLVADTLKEVTPATAVRT